jgi:phage terminase small subunit
MSVMDHPSAYGGGRLDRLLDRPQPPDHLSDASKKWWGDVVRNHDVEPHMFRVLQAAAESWDRNQQAREALNTHGLSYTDDKGMIRSRPEVQIERDSRTAFLRALREMRLDIDPPSPQPNLVGWTPGR